MGWSRDSLYSYAKNPSKGLARLCTGSRKIMFNTRSIRPINSSGTLHILPWRYGTLYKNTSIVKGNIQIAYI